MEWYYANDGQREGPVPAEELARLVAVGTVRDETLVWRAGMNHWQPWREVAPTVQLPAPAAVPPDVPNVAPVARVGTSEGGMPERRYAGFWIRLLAKLIDGIALMVVSNILTVLLFSDDLRRLEGLDPNDPAAVAEVMGTFGQLILVGMLLGLAYQWFFLAKFAATPGKLVLGLRVIRGNGAPLSHGRIVGRFFAEYLSTLILYIGYLIAAFDEEKRALHDTLCDTRVVHQR